MNSEQHALRPKVLLIDRQRSWLDRSALALRHEGFDVLSIDHYDYAATVPRAGREPMLIVLGSASIGKEELRLIEHVHANNDYIMVLSTALPWNVMRQVFLIGADDVTDKPYDPASLVSIIHDALPNIIAPR